MDSDEEDIQRMRQVINDQKTSLQSNNQIDYEDLINFSSNDDNLDEDDDDQEEHLLINEFDDDPSTSTDSSLALKAQERLIIDRCPDPELKTLLIYNRKKNLHLIKLHKKIFDTIVKCQNTITNKQHEIRNIAVKVPSVKPPSTWKLAAPYFKDADFYSAPMNDIVKRKRANEELSIYDMSLSKRWREWECERLKSAVICVYNIGRQNEVKEKIAKLFANGPTDSAFEQVKALNAEMRSLKREKEKDVPPFKSDELIDWFKVSSVHFNDKRSMKECKAMWHLYLHPQINKGPWSEAENSKLKAIAKASNMQNWDLIASELGTNRTCFTVCLHFVRNLNSKLKKTKFSLEEDQLLKDAVENSKRGSDISWSQVSRHFENRTRVQLYHRYVYYLAKSHVTKGKFSDAEDILLMILVNKFGKQFKKCAEYMPHRSQVQLKSRYNSNLVRLIKKGSFTEEEDEEILKHVELKGEKSWGELSKRLHRARGQLRQRYFTIKTFLVAHPGASLESIPKRRHEIYNDNDKHYEFLQLMAKEYGNDDIIPTLAMIEECLKNKKSDKEMEQNVDSMIVDLFASSLKTAKPDRIVNSVSANDIKEATTNASLILSLLKVDLKIPEDLSKRFAHLDANDKAILEKLRNETLPVLSCDLVPPQLNTTLGLRSLLIMHYDYESMRKSASIHEIVETPDYDLFTKRFRSLFYWSSILSLQQPDNQPSTCRTIVNAVEPTVVIPDEIEPPSKRIKIVPLNQLLESNRNKCEQIHYVDKSVVEALMKKNKLKILPIMNAPIVQNSSQSSTNSLVDEIAVEDIEDDIEDIRKLDFILKTESSTPSTIQSSVCDDDEEIEDIREDGLLLLYDKLKKNKSKIVPILNAPIIQNNSQSTNSLVDEIPEEDIEDDIEEDIHKLDLILKTESSTPSTVQSVCDDDEEMLKMEFDIN